MVQTIASVELPVGESLLIQKNRLCPKTGGTDLPRACIVTGTHGDELEGQYVVCRLLQELNAHPDCLRGIVDVYPALNPLGVCSITRGLPLYDLDMNRIFPGSSQGPVFEYAASRIVEDIRGADLCVDIHASNIFLRELPQVRVSEETAPTLLPLAKRLNMDFIWVHGAATVLQSTLAHSLNSIGTPTLVVEMGVGMRITQAYGEQLLSGLLSLLSHLGIWAGPVQEPTQPIVSSDGHVGFVNSNACGVFLPSVAHMARVHEGQELGVVADPLTGQVAEVLHSPLDGLLFTLREYPVVYGGSLIARILGGVPQ